METVFIKTMVELADKYGIQTVITIVCITILIFVIRWGGRVINKLIDKLSKAVETKHTEAMGKLNNLTDELKKQNKEISSLVKMTVRHEANLEHGDMRFVKVEKDISNIYDKVEYLRQRCHDISNNVHKLRNETLSKEQVRQLLELNKEKSDE